MESKALLALPLDPKPMEQVILRVQHHLYYWLRLYTKEIDVIKMKKFGQSVPRESEGATPAFLNHFLTEL